SRNCARPSRSPLLYIWTSRLRSRCAWRMRMVLTSLGRLVSLSRSRKVTAALSSCVRRRASSTLRLARRDISGSRPTWSRNSERKTTSTCHISRTWSRRLRTPSLSSAMWNGSLADEQQDALPEASSSSQGQVWTSIPRRLQQLGLRRRGGLLGLVLQDQGRCLRHIVVEVLRRQLCERHSGDYRPERGTMKWA